MAVHVTLLFTLFVLPLVWAQFPAVCNMEDSLSTKTCCPDNCGSHGTCVSIREQVESSWESANATVVEILRGLPGWPQDVRYQWPLKIFEKVCSCDKGWGSYDCSQCDFGYISNEADDCVKQKTDQLLVRRNFLDLSEQEHRNYIKLVEAAKNAEEKEWAAITSVPEEPNDYYNLQNVSTYDMIVFTHFLSVREKESTICPNTLSPNATDIFSTPFAHMSTPFLPWHRYFTLRYESELRRIGERMGISDFTLPYWDWTPASSCLIFSHELFGTPEHNEVVVNVSGTLFENGNWPTVCDFQYRAKAEKRTVTVSPTECAKVRTLCDVEADRMANRPLQRGAWRDEMRGFRLPDYKPIAMTLSPDQFEGTLGFANHLEGFLEQCSGESVKCMFTPSGGDNVHGIVHEFVGGQLSIGAPSTNDPVFFLHHANVDRILERWLQKYNGTPPSYQPISGGPPGHNFNDYFVPQFPLKKISDMYKESKELGYIYADLPWDIPTTDYQLGCPSEQCDKGGYPPTVLVNSTSAYCTKTQLDMRLSKGT